MLSTFQDEKLDPRVVRTRSLLEQAFMDALNESGFQAVSVQDITNRAGVNRATFYAHFADKYALLDHTIRQMFRHEIDKRMLNACQYSEANLRALIIAVCEFIAKTSSHCRPPQSQFESLVEAQVKAQVQELLNKWIEQTEAPFDHLTVATAASWAIYGLAMQWHHQKDRAPVEQYADEILPIATGNLFPSLRAA